MSTYYDLMVYARQHAALTARDRASVYLECFAPDYLFAREWDDLSEEAKTFYAEHHLPCEGTGALSACCFDCPFSEADWD